MSPMMSPLRNLPTDDPPVVPNGSLVWIAHRADWLPPDSFPVARVGRISPRAFAKILSRLEVFRTSREKACRRADRISLARKFFCGQNCRASMHFSKHAPQDQPNSGLVNHTDSV